MDQLSIISRRNWDDAVASPTRCCAGLDCCSPSRDGGMLAAEGSASAELSCYNVGEDVWKGREREKRSVHHLDMAVEGTPTQTFHGTAWCCHQMEGELGLPPTQARRQNHVILAFLESGCESYKAFTVPFEYFIHTYKVKRRYFSLSGVEMQIFKWEKESNIALVWHIRLWGLHNFIVPCLPGKSELGS